jgi:hypothetical protein
VFREEFKYKEFLSRKQLKVYKEVYNQSENLKNLITVSQHGGELLLSVNAIGGKISVVNKQT